jgi:PhzF family phenazine biosynthesis protein
MRTALYQVDAFTEEVFRGNPAAVCPLESWPEDSKLLAIAAENNLAETAFLVPEGEGYRLRWFTPRYEVQLCGHATLASGYVLLKLQETDLGQVRFETRSGALHVMLDGDYLSMDFPALPPRNCPNPPPQLAAGLASLNPREVLQNGAGDSVGNYFVVYETEEEVRRAHPKMAVIEQLHPAGVCITAPGREVDFVSRYFAPSYGIPEDPVTGSTHCALAPYWADRLQKSSLRARQLSERGGEVLCTVKGDRVILKGKAVLYLQGTIFV